MKKERASARPIRLHFRSVEKVLVEPDDRDRFLMTAREAAQACKHAMDEREWEETFGRFLLRLREWCVRHAEEVESCYLDIGDGVLNVLIGTKGEEYHFGFDDEVTELDLKLVKEFPWSVVEMIQVPARVGTSHISSDKAIQVYGDGKRASKQGRP